MATVTGYTAERMQEIEDSAIVGGEVVGDDLILTKHDGSTINAGPVIGPTGPQGIQSTGIPGEVKLWPGDTLPDDSEYGLWTWANGGVFVIADHPLAYDHIDRAWDTAHGQANPGAGNFRVPDLRGLAPVGLDAMPIGSTRANRVTRSLAIVIAGKSGEETHVITVPEMAVHAHLGDPHIHELEEGHTHYVTIGYSNIKEGAGATRSLAKQTAPDVFVDKETTPPSTNVNTKVVTDLVNTGNAGGDDAHENMQPTVFVPYIVKLDD